MNLPLDKKKKLQCLIQEEVSSFKLNKSIDEAIANCSNCEETKLESQVIDKLIKNGLIEEIVNNLQLQSELSSPNSVEFSKKHMPHNLSHCVCLHVYRGKAFSEDVNLQSNSSGSFLKLFVHFRGQRFQSKSVLVSCEPNFSESFFFQLNPLEKKISLDSMLSISDPIHIIMVRCNPFGETTLVSSFFLEWRDALSAEKCSSIKVLEMMGIGSENKVHVGILEVKLQIIPELEAFIPLKVIDAQLHLEKQRRCENERLFLCSAKQWWREYIQINKEFKTRPIKIFAEDETGKNQVVCGFIQPFGGCRLINSPRQAARYVSTFQLEKASSIGSSPKANQWQSFHAFLCSKKGDHEDHSNFLCSLLLGFGLDAYVCIGLDNSSNLCSWVVVKYCDDSSVFFWDATTGHRYSHHLIDLDDAPSLKFTRCMHPFKTVGCAYNHKSFYANVQPIDIVQAVDFSFETATLWKCINVGSCFPVSGNFNSRIYMSFPPLNPSTMNGKILAKNLEESIKSRIYQYREEIDLITEWDDNISSLLGQTLAAYEAEKLYGLPNMDNNDFQDAIKRAVPEGDTFKGFPIQFLHCNPDKIFKTCLKNKVFSAIISCRGDSARHAVRCYVTVFPDDLVAVWFMVACRYRSIF